MRTEINANSVRPIVLIPVLFLASFVQAIAGTPFVRVASLDTARKIDFSIPAQDLAAALVEFSKQASVQVIIPGDDIKALRSDGARGRLSISQALAELLKSSGLTYKAIGESAISIGKFPVAASVEDGESAVRLAQVQTPSSEAGEALDTDRDNDRNSQKPQEIIVTGTHIHNIANRTAPVMTFDAEQLRNSGHSTLQDFFEALPQNFGGGAEGASEDGVFGGGVNRATNFTGGSAINLRGLGASSTLVLINGHRMAPSQFGLSIDVSLVPMAAVERIEILTDGSSAIYGADAVAGVVNILLKKDYSGAQTTAKFGGTTQGGRDERTLSQVLGTNWTGGNAVLTLQYQEADRLPAQERALALLLAQPTDLLPETETYGANFNVRQTLTDTLEIFTDALYSRKDIGRFSTRAPFSEQSDAQSASINAAMGLRWQIAPRWSIQPTMMYSRNSSDQLNYRSTLPSLSRALVSDQRVVFDIKSVEILSEGKAFTAPGGDIGFAIGGAYREEDFIQYRTLPVNTPRVADRTVSAAFGEIYLPLVGAQNRMRGVRALELSGALRYDDYSDFGSSVNPRIGLLWSPAEQLDFRMSYSKAFRTPNAAELLIQTGSRNINRSNRPSPTGVGTVPVFELTGAGSFLGPEKSRTYSAGLDFKPARIPGLTLEVNYFDIFFKDRIITPPFTTTYLSNRDAFGNLITDFANDAAALAFLNAALAEGAALFDPNGLGAANIRFAFDRRQLNAQSVKQSGADFTARYVHALDSGTLTVGGNLAMIRTIDTQISAGARGVELASTYGNPVDLRVRVDSGWTVGGWSLNGALNYIDHYRNVFLLNEEPISSWTTLDFNMRYAFADTTANRMLRGLSIGLTALNAFDRDPPVIRQFDSTLLPVAYDPANTNPNGRSYAIEVRKSW